MLSLPCGGEYCAPLEEHDGIRIGDRITFRAGGRHEPLITGTVREMYLERHPNTLSWRPDGAVFAEVDLDVGGEGRCWFARDKPRPAAAVEGALGAIPEGAMF